jgi:hypothetical protein
MGVVAARSTAVVLCVLTVSLGAAFGAGAGAAPQPRTAAVPTVTLLQTSQKRILARRALRVKVSLPDAGMARLTARSRLAAGGKATPITTKKKRRLPAGGAKLNLKLSADGAAALAQCDARRLGVKLGLKPRHMPVERARDRAKMVVDLDSCKPPPGGRAYAIDPGGDERHTNGTPRELAATGTGSDKVFVALFACANVTEVDTQTVEFAQTAGRAEQGTPGASLKSLGGNPTSGSPTIAGPAQASGGSLPFKLSGSNGCAVPVAFLDSNHNGGLDVDAQGVPTESYGAGGQTSFEAQGVNFQNAGRCDPLDPAVCLYPWPNDHFAIADSATKTDLRLNLQSASMPQNTNGIHIDPTDYNRSDGFSPGQMLVTKVPGLDTQQAFDQTGAVPLGDIGRSADQSQPVVVIDAATGERWPIWSEIDANPANPADRTLIIRPAVNFKEGHHYVVALRNLKDAAGNPIEAGRAFQLFRDRIVTSDATVEARRPELEKDFQILSDAGIPRKSLYLAWDFTVASERSLSERMLSIRDDAFAKLGDTNLADGQIQGAMPSFAITSVTNYDPCDSSGCSNGGLGDLANLPDIPGVGDIASAIEAQISTILGQPPQNDKIVRKVEGQFVVPCYLNQPGCLTGSRFQYSSATDNTPDPIPGNIDVANFICLVPRSAVNANDSVNPARVSLYGHGLLGSAGEVEAGNVESMANEHDFVFCATDWQGFSTSDAPTVLSILQDLSNFPELVDRTQQGFLNFLYLARLMDSPQGFSANSAFQVNGHSVIDPGHVYYDGNSQGGILGGGLTAVSPDFTRAVLGVPAMNYSTLLERSSDFAPYAEGKFCGIISDACGSLDSPAGLYDNYPNQLERPLIFSLMQILWDRGEADGYAQHMTTDPLPNTPEHTVLMHEAYGDHQVTNYATHVEARTIGAHIYTPTLDPGRSPLTDPFWGIPAIDSYPFGGSALVVWDSGPPRPGDDGVLPPPVTDTPPSGARDPHSDPRGEVAARLQKSEFLKPDGAVVNVCGVKPCYAHGWTGP